LTQDAAFTAFVEKRTPAARWGAPEEVAQATLFLLSPAASYVNGTLLHVDGGLHVQV
jgi:gluconate 5-dehydrogenase